MKFFSFLSNIINCQEQLKTIQQTEKKKNALHRFTNNSFRIVITWKARNIRSLFPLKDKNDYKSCVFYKGDCSCGSRYIGETKRNAEVR